MSDRDPHDGRRLDFRSRLLGELATSEERNRGGLDWKTTDDEILARVRAGVEIEDAVIAYLDEVDGPLGDPAAGLERLRRAVGRSPRVDAPAPRKP